MIIYKSSVAEIFVFNTLYTNLQFILHHFFTLIGTDVYNFGATLRDATSQSVGHQNKQSFKDLLTT